MILVHPTWSAHVPGRWRRGEDIGSRGAAPWDTVACIPWSTLPSGALPDTHRDPRMSAPVLPSRDYRMEHVETPLQACEHNWLPTRLGWEGRRPTNDLAEGLCQPGGPVGAWTPGGGGVGGAQ